jgi:hypothetical protein
VQLYSSNNTLVLSHKRFKQHPKSLYFHTSLETNDVNLKLIFKNILFREIYKKKKKNTQANSKQKLKVIKTTIKNKGTYK